MNKFKSNRGLKRPPISDRKDRGRTKERTLKLEVPDLDDPLQVPKRLAKNSPAHARGTLNYLSKPNFFRRNSPFANDFLGSSTSSNTPRANQKKPIRFSSSKKQLQTSKQIRPMVRVNSAKRMQKPKGLPRPLSKKSSKAHSSRSFKGSTISSRSRENLKPENQQLSDIVTKVSNSAVSGHKQLEELSPQQIEVRSDILYKQHLFSTFQALKYVRNLPEVQPQQLRQKRLILPKRPGFQDKKTAVFDLDETLVHCVDDVDTEDPDFIVNIVFPTGQVAQAGINLRPFAVQCLIEANKYFQVVVFTASHQCYADKVLDHIDPQRELIHHRLYRHNCINVDTLYIKDLRVFGNRNLKDIVIIDNAAYSFAYQIDNGIPIISWHDNYYDKELSNLIEYLKLLAESDDIRNLNRETFHLRTFYDDYIQEIFGQEVVRSLSPEQLIQ